MSSEAPVPTFTEFAQAVGIFGRLTLPDRSYNLFQVATKGAPDLSQAAHRHALHTWLNAWGCRIRYPREGDTPLFDRAVADWWAFWSERLPSPDTHLPDLDDDEIDVLGRAYGDLSSRGVAPGRKAGSVRTLGPTATAKTLYALQPMAVTAWDRQIGYRLYGRRDQAAFCEHLRLARRLAGALLVHAASEADLSAAVGRPNSSLAKLLDEYWYVTIPLGP
jgi:hypothetical protein